MMTREQKIEMFEDRMDGLTYDEIGAKYGVSRQRAHQIITGEHVVKKKVTPYKGLNRWMRNNNISTRQLSILLDVFYGTIHKYLSGFEGMPKWFIDEMLNRTGMTYEELFERKDDERK